MPDTPDPVAAALDEIRAHSDLDGPRFNPNFTCDVHVPRLLAAAEAALKRHRPVIRKQGHPAMCEWDNRRWPCPEVADITAELTGKGAGDE